MHLDCRAHGLTGDFIQFHPWTIDRLGTPASRLRRVPRVPRGSTVASTRGEQPLPATHSFPEDPEICYPTSDRMKLGRVLVANHRYIAEHALATALKSKRR